MNSYKDTEEFQQELAVIKYMHFNELLEYILEFQNSCNGLSPTDQEILEAIYAERFYPCEEYRRILEEIAESILANIEKNNWYKPNNFMRVLYEQPCFDTAYGAAEDAFNVEQAGGMPYGTYGGY